MPSIFNVDCENFGLKTPDGVDACSCKNQACKEIVLWLICIFVGNTSKMKSLYTVQYWMLLLLNFMPNLLML